MAPIKYLTIIISLGFSFHSIAQSDFREGFIVLNSGDTINGYLDYKGNIANAKKCTFRRSEKGENQVYNPTEIKGFKFSKGKYYISRSFLQNGSEEFFFLEFLINGIVNIYYYRDFDGQHYLVENEEGRLFELKEDFREIKRNGRTYEKIYKEYVGVLKNVFINDMDIVQQVDMVQLNHKDLIDITKDYHNKVCNDYECIIYGKELPPVKTNFGLSVAFNSLSLNPKNDYFVQNNFSGQDFDKTTYWSLGLFLEKNIPYINERSNMLFEVYYARIQLQKETIEEASLVIITQSESLQSHSISSNFGLLHKLKGDKINPFFMGGFFTSRFFSTYKWSFESVDNSTGEVLGFLSTDESQYRKWNFGLFGGAGIQRDVLSNNDAYLSLRYYHGLGFRHDLSTSTLQIHFALTFK